MRTPFLKLKVQFTPKSKFLIIFPLLSVVLFIHLDCFWCELLSFEDISSRDVCLLWSKMELDDTWLCGGHSDRKNTVEILKRNHHPQAESSFM